MKSALRLIVAAALVTISVSFANPAKAQELNWCNGPAYEGQPCLEAEELCYSYVPYCDPGMCMTFQPLECVDNGLLLYTCSSAITGWYYHCTCNAGQAC